MATHVLRIPGWRPTLTNILLRMHWKARNRALKDDAAIIWAEAYSQGIPKATGKRRMVQVIQSVGNRRPPDDDATLKSLQDGLVKAGLLIDDSSKWLEVGPTRHEVATKPGIYVELTDL